MRHQNAFTMIELIMVILLIGVLSVTVLPKLFSKSELSSVAVRDQLISQLRLTQLKALNHYGVCHNFIITALEFGRVNNTTNTCGGITNIVNAIDASEVTIAIGSKTTLELRFDRDGRPIGGDCDGGCTITVVGSDTTSLTIESEGFIHES